MFLSLYCRIINLSYVDIILFIKKFEFKYFLSYENYDIKKQYMHQKAFSFL